MKLLPCPFCGGEAEIERLGTSRSSTIYTCTDCGCSLETGEEWNHGSGWNQRFDVNKELQLENRMLEAQNEAFKAELTFLKERLK